MMGGGTAYTPRIPKSGQESSKHQPGLHIGHFLFVQRLWHANHDTVTAQYNAPELAMLITDIDAAIPGGPPVFRIDSLQY